MSELEIRKEERLRAANIALHWRQPGWEFVCERIADDILGIPVKPIDEYVAELKAKEEKSWQA